MPLRFHILIFELQSNFDKRIHTISMVIKKDFVVEGAHLSFITLKPGPCTKTYGSPLFILVSLLQSVFVVEKWVCDKKWACLGFLTQGPGVRHALTSPCHFHPPVSSGVPRLSSHICWTAEPCWPISEWQSGVLCLRWHLWRFN